MVIGDEVANREMYQFTLMYLPRPPPKKKKKRRKIILKYNFLDHQSTKYRNQKCI